MKQTYAHPELEVLELKTTAVLMMSELDSLIPADPLEDPIIVVGL
jgi:hypothetical protein